MMKKRLIFTAIVALGLAQGTLALNVNAWMQEARKTPAWFTKGVIYHIQPRAFTPEGTLRAMARKLPYLKELGVTIVYLVPVMKMDESTDRSFWSKRQIRSGQNNPKNPYRIADYFHVDPEYGSDRDLKDFCAAAHKQGLYVLLDLVYLHCGPSAPILKEHPAFTFWHADGTVRKGPWRFPKLNFAEPKLREYLLSNVRCLLLEYGADGFRCDVGTGVPLDFWHDVHDLMDAVTASHAVLICEGHVACNQFKGFDADYGPFPGGVNSISAAAIRDEWTRRERDCPHGARYVNYYENQDIATDRRPRQEVRWGASATEQVLVWMLTVDGIPMLFQGNEMGDVDAKHSLFGKTPMDWSQLERAPGKARHALVKRLIALRHQHAALTAVNGLDGLTWLDATGSTNVTAFVRRGEGETILVVQNWSAEAVTSDVSFAIRRGPPSSYLAEDETCRDIRGAIADQPIFARGARRVGMRRFALEPWGFFIVEIREQ